jgi:predicted nucleic-acid-binding Zn-ribbon protein
MATSYEVHLPIGEQLRCLVCAHDRFRQREILLNTSGATFFNVEWANKSGMGAVCERCGYVHTFLDGRLEWRDVPG